MLLEQDVAELGGGVDVELAARDAVDRPLEVRQLLRERPRDLAQALEIDQHPVPLHVDEHGGERHLDGLQQPRELVVLELGLERVPQPEHGFTVGGAVAGRIEERHGRERPLPATAADQLLIGSHA